MPAPQPVPPPTGPLGHYLTHPGATTDRLVHHLAQVAAHLAVTFGPVAAGIAVALADRGDRDAAGSRPPGWATAPGS